MGKKSASENLEYIQSKDYKDMKEMFPLDDTRDNQSKMQEDVSKTKSDKKDC